MDAVTYPQPQVAEFVTARFVPLRVPADARPLAEDFNVQWTPLLAVLDAGGRPHARSLGFLPPEDFVPWAMLGIARERFDAGRLEAALEVLHEIQARHPKSPLVPEAVFLEGVSRYKHSHDPKTLKDMYAQLQADFPESDWARRAAPYRLL